MTRTTPPIRDDRRPRPQRGPTTSRPEATAAPTAPADGTVVLAAVTGAHGVGGEVRLKLFGDDVGTHRSFNGGALTLTAFRATPQGAIARFAEVPDRTAAEALRGTELTVPRASLPALDDGEYYHVDLLGLTAVDEGGGVIGTVVAVDNFGASDVIEIERLDGKRVMIPMTEQAVPRWGDGHLTVADGWHD